MLTQLKESMNKILEGVSDDTLTEDDFKMEAEAAITLLNRIKTSDDIDDPTHVIPQTEALLNMIVQKNFCMKSFKDSIVG